MAAALAKGETVLVKTLAREPEIDDLGHCLIAMGAKISGLALAYRRGRRLLAACRRKHAVLPDRIETGTFAMATAIAGGRSNSPARVPR